MPFRIASLTSLLLTACILLPLGATAQSAGEGLAEERIREFQVDLEVTESGGLNVTERIFYDFGTADRHGIIRTIPLVYGSYPDEVDLVMDVISVTDETGEEYEFSVTKYYDLEIKIGDPDKTITGAHWYVISYTVDQVVNGFPERDELYWNATGDGWSVPIDSAAVTVTIPEGSPQATNAAVCYTGYFGSTRSDCTASVESATTYRFSTTEPLSPYTGLTVAAGFAKGLVDLPATLRVTVTPVDAKVRIDDEPAETGSFVKRLAPGELTLRVTKFGYESYETTLSLEAGKSVVAEVELAKTLWWKFIESVLPFLLLPGAGIPLYLFWRRHGRDTAGRGTIIAHYEPPVGLTPGEVGVVVDEKAHLHDISASLIQLAVLGYLKIRREEKKRKLGIGKPDYTYTFIKVKEAAAAQDLAEHEKKVFAAIFGKAGKTEVKLSELQNKFYTSLPGIKDSLYAAVVAKGFFATSPDKVRRNAGAVGVTMVMILLFLSFTVSGWVGSGWYTVVAVILSVEILLVAAKMAKKTRAGAEAYEQIKGFTLLLTTAEKERLKFFQSPESYAELFEKYLPYAIALEVEEQWAKQFEGIYNAAPDWYEGAGNQFSALALTHSLQSLNTSATQTFSSSPSSSGSGGSGYSGGSGFSGGSSGGGFGGGGGSSW